MIRQILHLSPKLSNLLQALIARLVRVVLAFDDALLFSGDHRPYH
jgi:hypothetical protein